MGRSINLLIFVTFFHHYPYNEKICKMKKELKIEITELFMAQADKYRCFHGIIKRSKDEDGNTLFYSKIKVNNGYIHAQDSDRDRLGKKLDEMCVMILDKGLHKHDGVYTKYLGMKMYLN